MKKIVSFLAAFVAIFALSACSGEKKSQASSQTPNATTTDATIRIGATPMPHAEILEVVRDEVQKAGFTLEIVEFNDYVTPNLATQSGELDANFFQHTPYLDEFNANKGTQLVKVVGVHLEPMAAYSRKISNISELKAGDKVLVPNDPTNENRALDLLAEAGLIELDANVTLKTVSNIVSNPLGLVFVELEGPALPRALDDAALAVINTNFAKNVGLNPSRDGLLIENGENNPYVNILVVKAGNENSPKTQILAQVLQSEAVKEFLKSKYDGEIIPAF